MERPELMDDDTLRLHPLLERFGSGPEERAHVTHRGTVRSVGDERAPAYRLDCECGAALGPWA